MIYNENGIIMNNDNIISLIEASIQKDAQNYIYESEILKNLADKGRKTFKAAKEKVLQFVEFMKKKMDEFAEFIQYKIRGVLPKLNEKRIRDNYNLMKHTNPRFAIKDTNYQNQKEFSEILLKEMPEYIISVSAIICIVANEKNDEDYFRRFDTAADEICMYMANNFTAGSDLLKDIENILYKDERKSLVEEIVDKMQGKTFFDKDFGDNIDINMSRKSVDDLKKINVDNIFDKVKSSDEYIPSIKATNRNLDRMKKEVEKYDKKNDLVHYNDYKGYGNNKIDAEDYNSLYDSIIEIYNFGADLIKYIKKCMAYRISFLLCLSSPRLTRWLKSAA